MCPWQSLIEVRKLLFLVVIGSWMFSRLACHFCPHVYINTRLTQLMLPGRSQLLIGSDWLQRLPRLYRQVEIRVPDFQLSSVGVCAPCLTNIGHLTRHTGFNGSATAIVGFVQKWECKVDEG